MSNVDHIAIAQRGATQAQRRSLGQVASQQKRAQRDDERNAKRGGGGRMPSARGRRAPKSASQFHFRKKYSNRSGKNRAPSSALKKLAYDFRLTLTDADGREVPPSTKVDDLDYAYTSAAPGTPVDALDLSLLAQEAQRSAGRQSNSRQMAHYDISLPADLSDGARHALVRQIADDARIRMDNVPVFCAVHRPDGQNGNWHVHISHPIRQTIKVDDDGAFKMGERIMHEQRPQVREAAGLPKRNTEQLKAHRQTTADLIASALGAEGHDHHTCERWRHGHLTLARQVDRAAKRGDVQFVIDNHSRSATKHEGPSAHHGKLANDASLHNKDTSIDAALVTCTMINQVLETAQRLGIDEPENLRMLARDMGLQLHWTKDRESGNVQGVQWQIINGPRLSGAAAGCSLGNLKRRMSWAETPDYKHSIARSGESFDSYKSILAAHGKGRLAGRGVSILDRVIDAQLQEKEAAIAAAETVAQVRAETEAEQPRQRPKRASSKDRQQQHDSLNSRNPSRPVEAKEAPSMDSSTIKNLMSELAHLPTDDTPKAVPPPPPDKLLQPPTQAQIDKLTESERQFLRDRYDEKVGGMDFKSPAYEAQERVRRLWLSLQKINNQEPFDHDHRLVEVKRLFRKPVVQESPQLVSWRERQAEAQEAYQTAYTKTAANFARIYRDPELWSGLPAFRAQQAAKAEQAEQAKQAEAERRREANLQRNRAYVTGERQSDDRSDRHRHRGG